VVALFALVAAGGLGWWLLSAGETKVEARLEDRGLVTFGDPFLVNLSDAGGARFLKATVQLVMTTQEEADHVQKTPVVLMHLRSTILELFTQQKSADLVTTEGKHALKRLVVERVNADLAPRKVIDVLFSEFVVQF
jgi:flagellar basal body-associated protein FliL